ncbi:ABC transporter permease [Subtercola boreus]|uniref:ABC transporter permease n=2 Tax=Subtercola boreus TaxID=120213 RepID=A0A3E0W763_9MICO|nr:ABC transporter permease subunit [Subtercola boreus]RFA18694.1 ABC transporter permease [Subtercola boreus]RFA18716.1 ABC transporter permease [Subtercola boreus]RFA25327.1 ABC transporter permease [Subtercola boreus]
MATMSASSPSAARPSAVRPSAVRPSAARVGAAPSRTVRTIILSLVGLLFAVPILAMIEFTFRDGLSGTYTLKHWLNLADPAVNTKYAPLATALGNSLVLVLVTVLLVLVLLLPTMILVELRFAKLRRVLEFICIIPITVPAIVLVVGLVPVYAVVVKVAGSSIWSLGFAYGITVLPYAYRAIQANLQTVDVITLSEAARSLGAGWSTVLFRIILPNLRRGVLAASFISVAVVLGEFTIASLLNRVNLQTALLLISKSDPYVAVIFSLLALAFAFVLLLLIGRLSTVGAVRRPRIPLLQKR